LIGYPTEQLSHRSHLLTFACYYLGSQHHGRDLVAVVAGGVEREPAGGFGGFMLGAGSTLV